jgi:LacI family transcriptional regulator
MSSVTLKTIARATGFSVTTVSRALGGFDDVNEETRQIILSEARRQGYEPNLQARALQTQRTQSIGFILPVISPRFHDPFFSEFVAGVGNTAADSGFDLLLSAQSPLNGEIEHYRRLVAGKRVDGLVLIRTRYNDERIRYLAQAHVPFVAFGRTSDVEDYVYVDVDGIAGQGALTQHLIDLGHRRIGYITPPQDLMFSHFRLQGYRETMERNNIPVDESLIVEANLTEGGGSEGAHRLLALPIPPTAIMCGNDLMALGVMNVIQEKGLRVGDDIAVGGFDDIPLAEHIRPGLTTIHQPIYEIGQQIAHTLLKLIRTETVKNPSVLIKPELVVRKSSGPPRR